MRFKTDENIHPDVAALLREHGHDAVTIWDQSMRGVADGRIAEVCRQEERVLMSLDLDFADIRAFPPANYAGLLVLRIHVPGRVSVLACVSRLLPKLKTETLAGRLWIADEDGLRVRVRG